MPTYKVPNEIRALVKRAIDFNLSLPKSKRASMKEENGVQKPGTGMRTARRLISGNVDEKQLRLMQAWFARHGESELSKEARRDKTSKASIAWALWGGNPAKTWVAGTLRDIERKKNQKK